MTLEDLEKLHKKGELRRTVIKGNLPSAVVSIVRLKNDSAIQAIECKNGVFLNGEKLITFSTPNARVEKELAMGDYIFGFDHYGELLSLRLRNETDTSGTGDLDYTFRF